MEWKATWNDPLTRYLAPYHELIGDKRTHTTFDEVIKGIIGAGSLIWKPHRRAFRPPVPRQERLPTDHSPGERREYEAFTHRR
jgi:hypothetical protein